MSSRKVTLILIGVFVIGSAAVLGFWSRNTNQYQGPSNSNQIATNKNTLNVNRSTSYATFGLLAFPLPEEWTYRTQEVGGKACAFLASPERSNLINTDGSNTNDTMRGDGVIAYDAFVCDYGSAQEGLNTVIEQWASENQQTIIGKFVEDPFVGSTRFSVNAIRPLEILLFQRDQRVVYAEIEELPYEDADRNRRIIVNTVQQITAAQ